MTIDDSEIERAIKERLDAEERFRIVAWSVMLAFIGAVVAVVVL